MTGNLDKIKKMNSTLDTLLSHRSIRDFTDEPISDEILEAILEAGRTSSTSNYMSSISIIRITDCEQRKKFHQISNGMSEEDYNQALKEGKELKHAYVINSPEYFLFCMDNRRHYQVDPESQLDWMEVVLIATVDAGIVAQNMMTAAESLGLGGVYIGSMRNDIRRAGEVINAPKHVVPLFGMCLGHPSEDHTMSSTLQKPKWPLSVLVSENTYQPVDDAQIDDYNQRVKDYYHARGESDHPDWKAQVSKVFGKPVRPDSLPYLNDQGYAKR